MKVRVTVRDRDFSYIDSITRPATGLGVAYFNAISAFLANRNRRALIDLLITRNR